MTSRLLAVGTRKGLFLARLRGGTWEWSGPHFESHGYQEQAIYSIGIDQRGRTPRILVSVDSAHWGPSVYFSDDLGASWQEPKQAPVKFSEKTGVSLERIWQLQPADVGDPGVVYAGTDPAALFRSEDGGESFEIIESLWDHPSREGWQPGGGGLVLHTIVTDPRDPADLTVAVSAGGVYKSKDGGRTWEPSNKGIKAVFLPDNYPEYGQCVHKIRRDPVNPDRMFLQNHWGVYRSDDSGHSWAEIGKGLPSDFGFALAAHPRRADTAYVFPITADTDRVPANNRCRVYRTENAGNSWAELSEGLPDEGHYGTVLRDAMCVDDGDPAGVYFGNRNGEVFASVDDGDTWQQLASHFPDVLCVRAITLD